MIRASFGEAIMVMIFSLSINEHSFSDHLFRFLVLRRFIIDITNSVIGSRKIKGRGKKHFHCFVLLLGKA